MEVIPVIDVRGGQVVRAIAGDRANYRPLASPLAASSAPEAVAAGLMALHAFPVIYVADLDGIEGRGADLTMIRHIARAFPGIGVWVDNGARTGADIDALLAVPRVQAVIGSETGIGVAELRGLRKRFGDRLILSLDFRQDGYVGDYELFAHPAFWPPRVIVMTLGAVGQAAGPDFARVAEVAALTRTTLLYGAGGVRNASDLKALQECGAAGALVSSALHAQTITAADLIKVSGRSTSDGSDHPLNLPDIFKARN